MAVRNSAAASAVLALGGQGRAEVVVTGGRIRFARERGLQVGGGLVGAILSEQRVGQVVVQVRVGRIDREALLVGGNRRVHLAPGAERDAQVVVRRGVVRLKGHRLLVAGHGLVETAGLVQRRAQVRLGDRLHASGREHRPVHGDREQHEQHDDSDLLPPSGAGEVGPGGGQAQGGEEQQERHHREPVPREHVEHDDARRIGSQERQYRPQPPPVRPRRQQAQERERDDHAEVSDPGEQGEQRRGLLVGLLAFGVQHLAAVPEQRHLAGHQREPAPGWSAMNARARSVQYRRDLGRRQGASERALGQFGGVLPLVLRGAAAGAQRHVGAVGGRVVADEEVGPELRGGEVDAADDRVVARDNGQQDNTQPDQQRQDGNTKNTKHTKSGNIRSRAAHVPAFATGASHLRDP